MQQILSCRVPKAADGDCVWRNDNSVQTQHATGQSVTSNQDHSMHLGSGPTHSLVIAEHGHRLAVRAGGSHR